MHIRPSIDGLSMTRVKASKSPWLYIGLQQIALWLMHYHWRGNGAHVFAGDQEREQKQGSRAGVGDKGVNMVSHLFQRWGWWHNGQSSGHRLHESDERC